MFFFLSKCLVLREELPPVLYFVRTELDGVGIWTYWPLDCVHVFWFNSAVMSCTCYATWTYPSTTPPMPACLPPRRSQLAKYHPSDRSIHPRPPVMFSALQPHLLLRCLHLYVRICAVYLFTRYLFLFLFDIFSDNVHHRPINQNVFSVSRDTFPILLCKLGANQIIFVTARWPKINSVRPFLHMPLIDCFS